MIFPIHISNLRALAEAYLLLVILINCADIEQQPLATTITFIISIGYAITVKFDQSLNKEGGGKEKNAGASRLGNNFTTTWKKEKGVFTA